jgi:hypothetical protein
MMDTAPPPNPRFQALIQSLSALSGLKAEPDDSGLLLQAGPYQLRVMPDGSDAERLVIEVELADAAGAPAAVLALLHRINHVSRFHHGWQISLDEDEHIVLHTQRLLARTDADRLQELMASGLERAAAAAGLWHKALTTLEGEGAARLNDLKLDASALRV